MTKREKEYLNNNHNLLAIAVKMSKDKSIRKRLRPFQVRSFMKVPMVELIASYETSDKTILFDPMKNEYSEVFIVHIYEDKIEYAKTIEKSKDITLLKDFSMEYSEKLNWIKIDSKKIKDSRQLEETIMNLFRENSDYVAPSTLKKVAEGILIGIGAILCIAIFIGFVNSLISDLINKEIIDIIVLILCIVVALILYKRRKKKFLNKL